MIKKLILAIVVAIVVTLVCYLLGAVLVDVHAQVAIDVGNWLKSYGGLLGVLAGIWYFLTGQNLLK